MNQEFFEAATQELWSHLSQIKAYVKKHNPTIGLLTEEILRLFLKKYLPKHVSVEQGFVMSSKGELSRQSDILIYDSLKYAPFYRINDVVIIPQESLIAVIEVKTTMTKAILKDAFSYFKDLKSKGIFCHSYLFAYNSLSLSKIYNDIQSFGSWDHDTSQFLPDYIVGIKPTYFIQQDYVVTDRDSKGYNFYKYEGEGGKELSALQYFYNHIYSVVEQRIGSNSETSRDNYSKKNWVSLHSLPLFDL